MSNQQENDVVVKQALWSHSYREHLDNFEDFDQYCVQSITSSPQVNEINAEKESLMSIPIFKDWEDHWYDTDAMDSFEYISTLCQQSAE